MLGIRSILRMIPLKMLSFRSLVLLIACALLSLAVHAQDAPSDTSEVAMEVALSDSVVVTATRSTEAVRQTGRRVDVWTADDIDALPVSSYDELLRSVSGMDVQSRGGFGVQSDLTLRGSTFNGVLVLLDGARLNDPMTGHFLADFPVPLSEIERIEVMRGPATALYGPDALGGVVQIFTKTGLEEQAAEAGGTEGQVSTQVGQHNLYDVDGSARYATESTTVSVAATAQSSDGEPIVDPEGEPVLGEDGQLRTDFERRAASAAVSHDLGRATLYARGGVDDRDFNAYQFYTSLPSDRAREATSTYWAQARLASTTASSTRWRTQIAARQHEDTYEFSPDVPEPNQHTSRLLVVQGEVEHDLSSQLTVAGGASGSARDIDSNTLGTHDDLWGGAFVRAHWQPVEVLTVSGSGRLDHDSAYGTEVTPQVYVAYNRSMVTLRGGAGRAVRAPNYVERYYNTELDTPPDGSLGTPDLRAERAWAYEAGADIYPTGNTAVHVTGFMRTTDDLIDFALEPGQEFFQSRNVLTVDTRGIEVEGSYRQTLGAASRLQLTASYTGLEADIGDVDDGVEYTYAVSNARHLVQGTATLTVGNAQLGVQGLWRERIDVPDAADLRHGVVHVRGDYQLDALAPGLILSAEVRNVFDRQYSEVFNAPMPGRWFIAGVQVDL